MKPYEQYQKDLEREDFNHDPAQDQAMRHLQRVYDDLTAMRPQQTPQQKKGLLARLLGSKPATSQPASIKGLYLWGGVGRGKTYMVDTFFAALPFAEKKRIHFHRFMYKVHAELKTLKQQQEPLKIVANRFAQTTKIICLDEFFVSDITDAMLLAGLLQALVEEGVVLVTTSNIAPDDLYKNGLQRARFLPAIELIKFNLQVFHIDDGMDYRLRYLEKAEIYHVPLDEQAERILQDTFEHVAPEEGKQGVNLEIEGRTIPTRWHADGVVWFDFEAICDGPRSQSDYIEIARCFHTVLVSNIPVMNTQMENQARRFLNLIDEFYDHNVKLIVSAAAAATEIYQGNKLQFEYRRVISRLQEMQSKDYLARQHLC